MVGSIKEKSLMQIWDGQALRSLQKKHLQGLRHTFSPCKGCNHNEYSEKDNLDDHADQIFKKIYMNSI